MHSRFAALLLAPTLVMAQTSGRGPWDASLSSIQQLGNGECRPVSIYLKDSTGKDWPRRPDGRRVSIGDFDMTASPVETGVGMYNGPESFSVCACQGAVAAAAITVTAKYPAENLAPKLRVPGVAFTTSMPVTVKGPVGNSFTAPGCPAARMSATSAMTAAPVQQITTALPARPQVVPAPASIASSSAASATGLAPSDGTLYVSVTGNLQGAYKTETPNGAVVRGMAYALTAPVTSTGLRTGQRQYSVLTLSIEWGAVTPQLMLAFTRNETLVVRIDRRRPGGGSTDAITESIVLKSASVVGIKHVTDGRREVDEVSFTIRDITYTDAVDNLIMQDNMSSLP
jgi:type VI protein secretion system component Hcp